MVFVYCSSAVFSVTISKSSGKGQSHRKYSMKKAALKNFTTITGKLLSWSSFLIQLRDGRTGTI